MSDKESTLGEMESGGILRLLPAKWTAIVESVDFALQPIVSVHDGASAGFECLLRGQEAVGFESISSLFDRAYEEQVIHAFDLALREKAIAKFRSYPGHSTVKLFYNLDLRVLECTGYSPGATKAMLRRFSLSPEYMCFEVSERQEIFLESQSREVLAAYHEQGFSVAIDDYGIGFSGLQRLYECRSDYIKIDGFFLSDIDVSSRKRLFMSHVVGLAHVLGVKVVAEHVMTEAQFECCKTAGCDFVQGFLVGEPTLDVTDLQATSETVRRLNLRERRERPSDRHLVLQEIETVAALRCDADMPAVLEAFRLNPAHSFIPVVNALSEPMGVIREPDIKEYVYSRYGRELMVNPKMRGRLSNFIANCPVAYVNMPLDRMLEVFSCAQGAELLLLTEDNRYLGFLSASALLAALNERSLAIARDQNPLTRLPGNSLIAERLAEALQEDQRLQVFTYFDLDNFKAFNDVYGFRQGDRAILMLADTLREAAHGRDVFLGHIGGDDLFAAFSGPDWELERVRDWAAPVVDKFNRTVSSLFNPEDRERGQILTTDRSGAETTVPLLTVSCAVLAVPPQAPIFSSDALGAAIAKCKKAAKKSSDKIQVGYLTDRGLLLDDLDDTALWDQLSLLPVHVDATGVSEA